MCDNIIILYLFFIIKIIVFLIVPILLIIFRKKRFFNIFLYFDIIILLLFLISNLTNKNACLVNSSISNIKIVKETNELIYNNSLHETTNNLYSNIKVTPDKSYKTYTGRDLYYYNQNNSSIKDAYFECKNSNLYMNVIGSSITSFSTAISTLYDQSISPVEVFDYYKDDYTDVCNNSISIQNIYNSVMRRYGAIKLTEINKSQIESSIKNDGLIIAELSANEDSKLTCDNNYIVIYSIDLDGKYMISDPSLPTTSFICPYSSNAYGNIIDSNNMNKSFTLEEIDNEAIRYYLVKKG